MKKLLALLLAAMMIFSLAACGGGGANSLEAAAQEIEKITGEKTSVEDVQQIIDELSALSSEEVTPQDAVDFIREMYELSDDLVNETDGWPTDGYGSLIPEPDWEYEIRENKEGSFIVGFDEKSWNEALPYIEKLKEAGFDDGITTTGEDEFWQWIASNNDEGVLVVIKPQRIVMQPN